MDNPYSPEPHKARLPLVMMAIAVFIVMGLLLGTCSKAISKVPAAVANEEVFQKVGRQLQKVLGRTVNIHSDGIVAFPREVVEVVLENHDIQATTRYESRGWLRMGKSHVVMGGTYRARIGFDLGQACAEVEEGTLRLWLPAPRILGLETLDVSRQAEKVSWFNPLEPCEMEVAYRANRAEAERRLDEPELLKGATDRPLRRMREGLDDLGLKVRVQLLPSPPG